MTDNERLLLLACADFVSRGARQESIAACAHVRREKGPEAYKRLDELLGSLSAFADDIDALALVVARDGGMERVGNEWQPRVVAVGDPHVRDPESPCEWFEPGEPNGTPHDCDGDGHYLCKSCVSWNGREK